MIAERVIEARGLEKHYGDFRAVNGLNCSVRAECITGFLGRNGAGKSTTIKMLLGMVRPTAGNAKVLGLRVDDAKESLAIRREIAFVGEDKGLYGYMTVAELARFVRSFYRDWDDAREKKLMEMYALPPKRKVRALSKGMRTKLALLLALSRRPKLLILDEPTEGLDPVSIEELLQGLVTAPAEGTTVFFSSHQLAEVERVADDILMVDKGRVVLDMPLEQIRENYRWVRVGFRGEVPEMRGMEGVERVRVDGRQVMVLASSHAEGIAAKARELGAVTAEVDPVSLREIFLEMVQA